LEKKGFSGGPVVNILPSNAGGMGSTPVVAKKNNPPKINRSNVVINSIKTLKMVHIKKKKKKGDKKRGIMTDTLTMFRREQ